jgi:pantoate--beta-alanine ligase
MTNAPGIVTTLPELRARTLAWRRAGDIIALTPTMGALHEGHLDLVRLGRTRAARIITSIFVNPKQFAPHEDFDRYPRALADDAAKLAPAGVDLIWAPAVAEMYRDGFATRVEVDGAAAGLETDFRPHFFGGVATVCTKLFSQVQPDFAIFGEKDYQQLCVIRQIVRDLDLPLEIIGAPTRREPDGLALSSRNAYLTGAERQIAPALNRALAGLARDVRAGLGIEASEAKAREAILAAGFAKVDYVAVRDATTLAAIGPAAPAPDRPLRALAAAWLGRTRLIDNIAV